MIARRLLGVIPVVLGVSMIVFFLMHLAPGDPVSLLLPEDAPPEYIEKTKKEWGLDRPIPIQYLEFLKRALRGNFGKSLIFDESVVRLLLERVPATIELALASFFISLCISIPIGVLAASRHNSFWDHSSMVFALLGASLPHFWLGIMMIFVLGGYFDLLPVSGRIDYGLHVKPITHLIVIDSLLRLNIDALINALKHLAMPALSLGIHFTALVTRITRSAMLEVIREDYIITARVKGLGEKAVIWKHAFRNALCSITTVLGLQLGVLLVGSIVIETVFSWPGIGSLLIQAINSRDYELVQGVVFFFSITYIVLNFVVDLLYTYIDPRVRI